MIDPTLPRYCRIHSHSSTVSNTTIRMLLTAEETENSNGNPVELKAPALSSTPIQEENNNEQIISSLYHLKKYKTNRDAESAIVRLGRKGKTDKALQLYHTMWTLEGLKHQLRMHTIKQQKDKEDNNNNNNIIFDKGLQLPPPSSPSYASPKSVPPPDAWTRRSAPAPVGPTNTPSPKPPSSKSTNRHFLPSICSHCWWMNIWYRSIKQNVMKTATTTFYNQF